MANVSTDYKRLFVRNLLWTAQANSQSLSEVLKGLSQARIRQTQTGLVLTSTAANGHSSTFTIPGDGITTTDAAELCGEMWRRYDEAVAELGGSPTDQAIHDEMLRGLGLAARNVRSDFSALRMEHEEVEP